MRVEYPDAFYHIIQRGNETGIIKDNVIHSFIMGNRVFINDVKEKFIQDRKNIEIPVLSALQNQLKDKKLNKKIFEAEEVLKVPIIFYTITSSAVNC